VHHTGSSIGEREKLDPTLYRNTLGTGYFWG
jgi:hypothetical protein